MSVDFTEGFEYASDTAMLSVWSSSCGPNNGVMDLSTTRAHSGSKSLKLTFPPPDSEGGCFMDRNLSSPTSTFYMRVWIWLDNFTNTSGVGVKMWFAGANNTYPNYWLEIFGNNTLATVVTGDPSGGFNLVNGSIPQNQWACLEQRIQYGTAGQSNDVIQMWINDTLVMDRQNLHLRNAVLSNFNGPNSQIAFVSTYRQHGNGVIYYDDYAASRDTRIGLGGTPPPVDTTPPAIPTGIGVS